MFVISTLLERFLFAVTFSKVLIENILVFTAELQSVDFKSNWLRLYHYNVHKHSRSFGLTDLL